MLLYDIIVPSENALKEDYEMKKFDARINKKSSEELQEYLQFKRRGSVVRAKKGKGSYTRKPKHASARA